MTEPEKEYDVVEIIGPPISPDPPNPKMQEVESWYEQAAQAGIDQTLTGQPAGSVPDIEDDDV